MWDEEDQEVAMYWHQVEQAHHRQDKQAKTEIRKGADTMTKKQENKNWDPLARVYIPSPFKWAPCKHTAAHMVAETWDYWQHMPKDEAKALCRKLWGFQNDAKNPTPTGGDGSDGTVEDPRDTLDPANDDKMPHWWDKLTDAERRALTLAHKQQ